MGMFVWLRGCLKCKLGGRGVMWLLGIVLFFIGLLGGGEWASVMIDLGGVRWIWDGFGGECCHFESKIYCFESKLEIKGR